MMTAQYLRIETAAGGCSTSDLNFIRAAWRLLSERGKSRKMRDTRHRWLKQGLKHLEQARALGTSAGFRQPGTDQLAEWITDGGCEAVGCGCWVEHDGTCPCGNPSWFLKLGLI